MRTLYDRILTRRADPLGVLTTTLYVVRRARWVQINDTAIERAADTLAVASVQPPTWNYDYHFFDGTTRTVNYLFLLDALNFCFWGKPRWSIIYRGKRLDGYWALAAALKRTLEKEPYFADAEFLARLDPRQLARVLHGNTTIPLFTERWRNARELGTVLCEHWGSSAAALVAEAHANAPRLVQIIADNFASFNDVAVYENHEVRFFKRAQILVADLWGTFGGKQWGAFEHLEMLTAFADYKLPQILRAWGILRYAPSLARKIDSHIELAAGSPEEIEIRAATIWAVELLRDALARRGHNLWSIHLDWILWEASQTQVVRMKPYHRVRTIFY